MLTLVVPGIVIALIFDFINGFHDAANSIATVVSTRVLSPMQAVIWAAFFNFVAAFGFGVSVATTIGKGVVRFIIVSPLLGLVLGFAMMVLVILVFWRIRPSRIDRSFRRLQLVSAALYSLGHGTNDAQKTLGSWRASYSARAVTRIGTAIAGIPVSTTHTITGAISWVGATQRLSAVRWGVARQIVWAWVLTIPLSAAIAAASFALIKLFPLF